MRRLMIQFGILSATFALLITLSGSPANAIVGGSNATEQYGAMSVWSTTLGRNRCVASLITPMWALTAGHCKDILVPGEIEFRTSSLNNLSGYENPGFDAVFRHPDYDPDLFINDIALLRFKHPVERTQPLPLLSAGAPVDTVTKVAGWGWICQDPTNPQCRHSVNQLQELDTRVAPADKCPTMWDQAGGEFCTASAEGTYAMACFGDSGGPQVTKVGDVWALIGLTLYDGGDWDVSRPNDCSDNPDNGGPTGVWNNVSHYIPWIQDTIRNSPVANDSLPTII
jgi:secreted trypsin-like serine protease